MSEADIAEALGWIIVGLVVIGLINCWRQK